MKYRSQPAFLEQIEARLLFSAGQPDASFGAHGVANLFTFAPKFAIQSVALQSDGKVLVAGQSDFDNPQAAVIRLNKNGSIDKSFGKAGEAIFKYQSAPEYGFVGDIAVQSDGKIVVAGSFRNNDGSDSDDAAVARLNTNGTLDKSFGGGDGIATFHSASDEGYIKVRMIAGGKILLGGISGSDFLISRVNSNGSFDHSFHSTGTRTVDFGGNGDFLEDLAANSDGSIVAVGTGGPKSRFVAVRITSGGNIDRSFGSNGRFNVSNFDPSSLFIQSDGKLLVAGIGTPTDSQTGVQLRRFTRNGSTDHFGVNGAVSIAIPGFAGGRSRIHALQQSDGKIVFTGDMIAGSINSFNVNAFVLRTSSSGTIDSTFGTMGITTIDLGPENHPYGLAIGSDGGILFGDQAYKLGGDPLFATAAVKLQGK